MNLFTIIDDANAIIRLPKGIEKQVAVYHRNGRLYVPHGGGFVRITAKFGETFGTSHPSIKLIEIEAAGVEERKHELHFTAPLKVAA